MKGVKCQSNLEMPAPGLDSAREILYTVEDGKLTIEELDFCVDELLDAVLTLSGEGQRESKMSGQTAGFDVTAHHELARRAAAESIVLLKNEDSFLPLKPKTKVALIGDFAIEPRYQGAGSSMVNPTRVDSMAELIQGYDLQLVGVKMGYSRTGEADAAMKKEALDLAGRADVVLYCFGLDEISESEGMDRNHMRVPQNQIELLEELVKVNPHIAGIMSAGSSVEMPWHYCCKAILHGYLCGQAGAGAMLDVLTGKVNPSGRLNETYPVKYEDTPAFRYFPSTERNSEYREGLFVGYRYYGTSGVRFQYPFGYGLSYTEFIYSDLDVDESGVSFTLENTGAMDGAEVAQLYIGMPNGKVFRPKKELKGFRKIFLKKGEKKRIRIAFDDKSFRFWNVKTGQWETEGGEYQIMIGACVADIRLTGTLVIRGTMEQPPYQNTELLSYQNGLIAKVSDQEYEALLGYPLPDGKWTGELGMNDAICQMYYAKSGLARWIYRILTDKKKKSEEKGKPDLNILFIYNMPFRGIAKMTGGAVSMEMVRGMLMVVNGRFFGGIAKLIAGFFKNKKQNHDYEKLLYGRKGRQ